MAGGARDLTFLDRLGRLNPSLVSDCLDRIGRREQVMNPSIRPVY